MTISHIGKKVLFPDKELLIHLWKFVHIFMGGGNKLHITYQGIAIQMFGKTVYHPFYRLSGNFWLLSFKISYLCLPLFYETRTTPSCHPSGCAYRQL